MYFPARPSCFIRTKHILEESKSFFKNTETYKNKDGKYIENNIYKFQENGKKSDFKSIVYRVKSLWDIK